MNGHRPLFLFSFLALLCLPALGDLSPEIDPLFQAYDKPNVPGAAVLVMKDGDVIFEKGYGLRDLGKKTEVTVSTNFRLASLTKQFTAMAIAILASEGKLRLDETLHDIFPDFPDYGKKIKIDHLLHHLSGLKDYEDLIPAGQTKQILDADVLRMMKDQTGTDFVPGSRYRYSNCGYVLLAQIVEKRSGQSFAAFEKDRIFNPLWMSGSNLYEKDGANIWERAYGYSPNGGSFQFTDQSVTSATQGDGGVYTSLQDLFFWNRSLDVGNLLPAQWQTLLFSPGKLNDGTPVNYGFGWELGTYRGLTCHSHTGSTIGFRTAIQRYPEKAFSVVVLVNRAGASPWDIARSIVDKVLFRSTDHPQ